MPRLNDDQYMEQIRLATESIGSVEPKWLNAPIPHIEDWTVNTVVGHIGWVARYVTLCLSSPADNPPNRASIPEPPHGDSVITWFTEARTVLIEALSALDPDILHPTFTGAQPGRWWLRRLAHETSVHSWDIAAAIQTPDPINSALAEDGIQEIFDVFTDTRLDADVLAGNGETIHLHATDSDSGEWMVTLNPEGVTVVSGHEKGDVAVRGTTSDLLLLLWGRIPPSRLELFGETSLIDRWQQAATF